MSFPSYSSSVITAVGRVQEGLPVSKFILGGKGGSGATTFQLTKKDTTYAFNQWRSKVYLIGRPFNVTNISFRLSAALTTNQSIIPVLGFDDGANKVTGNTINTTNCPGTSRYVVLSPDSFSFNVHGKKNFYLELQFTGTALTVVELPITIEIETEVLV